MAHIIGIIQVKGGAGRSTIATNLAGILSAEGKRVKQLAPVTSSIVLYYVRHEWQQGY